MLKSKEFSIPENTPPNRADKLLFAYLPEKYSRSSVARLVRTGAILVNGHSIRPSTILKPGDRVQIVDREPNPDARPQENLILEHRIIFEDKHVIVVDKPAGLVVHQGAGRPSGTLVDALIRLRPEMLGVGEAGRWGVVHRLDRDTSGVMVLAKTALAYETLSIQFRKHSVHRVYKALVRGNPGPNQGIVDAPLGRHVKDRKRISTSTTKARHAVTRWTVSRRFGIIALLDVKPETGRTHQIRVHLASVGLPVLGDSVYGRTRKQHRSMDPIQKKYAMIMKRQALHAAVLGFAHPENCQYVEFSSPLPPDMAEVMRVAGELYPEPTSSEASYQYHKPN